MPHFFEQLAYLLSLTTGLALCLSQAPLNSKDLCFKNSPLRSNRVNLLLHTNSLLCCGLIRLAELVATVLLEYAVDAEELLTVLAVRLDVAMHMQAALCG